jgi:CelD/BcsL family acetyltransferase involved in cellulose biosynthesis
MVSHAPTTTGGRRRRSHDTTELVVTRLTGHAELVAMGTEYRVLYELGAAGNPFASPDWTSTWLRHFVPERDLAVLAVRRNGRLVGVAPSYMRRLGGVARSVQLAGTIRHPELTELPQVLTAPGEHRSVLRAVLRYWCARPKEWDWLELPIEAGQGWLEPEWVEPTFMVMHKAVRPAVVLPLPADVDTLRSTLKRNVAESLRRARNRLDKSGHQWAVTAHTESIAEALPFLRRLHGARAAMSGRRRHPDMLACDARFAAYAEAVTKLAAQDRAELLTLDVAGIARAALLVLRAPRVSYLTVSGIDPDWWHVSPVTLLQWTAMCRAVARGDTEVNLSVGPDVAKLRWSERVVPHMEFVVCAPRIRSRLLLTGYAALGAVAGMRREKRRHEVASEVGR